jgi:hypothetical protein
MAMARLVAWPLRDKKDFMGILRTVVVIDVGDRSPRPIEYSHTNLNGK